MIPILTGKKDFDMKRFIVFTFATALFAACSTQEIDIQIPAQDDVVFYASFEQPSDIDTRVYVNENLLLRWNADDRVGIFNRITYNQQYKFSGKTGDNAGGFRKVDTDEFVTGNAISHVVAVYPYQESMSISESEIISATLPAEHRYAEGTFDPTANLMVSVSVDNVLQFKNVGGFLVFNLYGRDVAVSSIKLRGNNDEILAGELSLECPLNGAPSIEFVDNTSKEISLVCDVPVVLGATAEESTQFWFVVPPTTFEKGFTVTVVDSEGNVFEKTTANTVTIARNRLARMKAFEFAATIVPIESNPEAVDLGLPSGVLWASMNVGAATPSDIGGRYAWGETETKDHYDWDNYKWCNGSSDSMTKYCTNEYYGTVDGKTSLDDEDDVAKVLWGDGWRMPLESELKELATSCTWTSETLDGAAGYRVTGPNGNSIFIPLNGQYDEFGLTHSYSIFLWASETEGNEYASRLECNDYNSYPYVSFNNHKHDGLCVRPVKGGAANLSAKGTANCYMIDKAGTYVFNGSVKGNSSESVGEPVSASVIWETFNTSTAPTVGDVISNVSFSNGYVRFSSTGTKGNALIAVKDSENKILWSWHIWVTDYDPDSDYDTYKGHESVKMMDRNLGAMSSEPGNNSIGLIYEWGRKDPFMGSTSLSSYSQFASTVSFPDCITSSSTIGTEKYAAENPTQYIIANSQNLDWLYVSDSSAWSSEKSKNDPCPKGWKVPDGGQDSVWSSFPGSISSTSGVNWNSAYYGITVDESLASNPVWYPAQGYHGDSETYSSGFWQVGYEGRYWTTATLGNGADYFQFKSNSIETYHASTSTHFSRANGMPVRCCSE